MEKTKKSNKEKTIGIVIGMVAFAVSFYGVKLLFKKDLETEMKKAALELNQQTPMKVDSFTQLDSASTIGKTNFIYHYTIIGVEKSEVDLESVHKSIRPNLIENAKNLPELKVFRDNNIIMDYKYYDKNGTFVTTISITPDLYK